MKPDLKFKSGKIQLTHHWQKIYPNVPGRNTPLLGGGKICIKGNEKHASIHVLLKRRGVRVLEGAQVTCNPTAACTT